MLGNLSLNKQSDKPKLIWCSWQINDPISRGHLIKSHSACSAWSWCRSAELNLFHKTVLYNFTFKHVVIDCILIMLIYFWMSEVYLCENLSAFASIEIALKRLRKGGSNQPCATPLCFLK